MIIFKKINLNITAKEEEEKKWYVKIFIYKIKVKRRIIFFSKNALSASIRRFKLLFFYEGM